MLSFASFFKRHLRPFLLRLFSSLLAEFPRISHDLFPLSFLADAFHVFKCSACGGELHATDAWQTLTSPSGKDVKCYWRISVSRSLHLLLTTIQLITPVQVPEGSHVRFRLSDGEFPCSYGCQSYVEIKHKLDIRLTGFRR